MTDGLRNGRKVVPYLDQVTRFVTDLRAGKGINVLPVHAELDLTSRCGLSCIWCRSLDTRYSAERPGDMSIRVVEQAAGMVRAITFKGGGEPTCHPEFETLCEVVRGHGVELGMVTNGTRAIKHPEDFKWLKVSVDAWDEDSFQRLKGGRQFDKALENIHDWSSRTKVGLSFLRYPGINYERCVEVAKMAGVRYCVFREALGFQPEPIPDWLKAGTVEGLSVHVEAPLPSRSQHGCWTNSLVLHIGQDHGLNLCCWTKYRFPPYAFATDERSVVDCWRGEEHAAVALRFLDHTCPCMGCRFDHYQAVCERARDAGETADTSVDDIEDGYFL